MAKKSVEKEPFENTTYIFIPFSFEGNGLSGKGSSEEKSFRNLVNAVKKEDSSWRMVNDKVRYMLKFVADKIDSTNEETCQCFHFRLKKEVRPEYKLPDKDTWCTVYTDPHDDIKDEYKFRIRDIDAFFFRTSVGIMSFRLSFDESEAGYGPKRIAAAQYYLKKSGRNDIHYPFGSASEGGPAANIPNGSAANTPDSPAADNQNIISRKMLDIAKDLMRDYSNDFGFNFFYYANPTTERANVLTFIPVSGDQADNYLEDLFFLRRCYNGGYQFVRDEAQEAEEIYSASADMKWGISPEAAACLACPERGRKKFIEETFFNNFNTQYVFMYVLLLHQKYVLYKFLTIIGNSDRNDLATLENYRNQLYAFETDFVFSLVTEVPQYQNLYDRMVQAFALRKMYEDVHEPITSLAEVRREATEKAQQARDKSLNTALVMLSLLSVFSALVDSFDFSREFLYDIFGIGAGGIRIMQWICIGLIFAIAIYVIRNFIKTRIAEKKLGIREKN